MATKKSSALSKVGKAVKGAAGTVADKADKYVVKPVGKALGLGGKKKSAKGTAGKKTKTGAARTTKSGASKSTKSGSTKKKTTAKRTAKSK